MVEVKVYNDIGTPGIVFDASGKLAQAFSAEGVKELLNSHPGEEEFRFSIHCNGGSTHEGFAIYDIIRTSGKRVYCNIDGGCHSMAVIILLAAPKENRSANPNATALIHDVYANAGLVSAGQAQELANGLKRERDRILAVYADRTGQPKDMLERVMLEEKERTAQELLEWGFISRINSYTNQKNKKMTIEEAVIDVVNKIKTFFNGAKNYAHTDPDGNVLFTTDKEDDSLSVGDAASPDGTFELADGRVVTIAQGVVESITDPAPANSVEELEQQVETLIERLNKAESLLREAQKTIANLANVKSTAAIPQRMGAAGNAGKQNKALTAEEKKDLVKSNLKNLK